MKRMILFLGMALISAQTQGPDPTYLPAVHSQGADWESLASMPTPRSETPAAVMDGIIYVPGGFGGESSFEGYRPAESRWYVLPPLPAGRDHLMAAAYSGRV